MIFHEAFSRMLPTVSQHVSLALLHFLWQGTLVALVLALILRVLRDPLTTEAKREDSTSLPPDGITRAGARYLISCFALAAMTVLPLVNLAVLDMPFERAMAFDSGTTANESRGASFAGGAKSAVINDMPGKTNLAAVVEAEPIPSALLSWTSVVRKPFLQCFFWVWIVGVAILSAWHVIGWNVSQHLRRRGTAPSDEVLALVWRIAGQLGIVRTIDV